MQPPHENISGLPDRLRKVIAESGLTQPKFAALIGEDLFRIRNVLSGQMKPPADLVQKVLERCEVDAVWLMTGRSLDIGETSPAEKILVENYRALPAAEQGVMQRIIAGLAAESLKEKNKPTGKKKTK